MKKMIMVVMMVMVAGLAFAGGQDASDKEVIAVQQELQQEIDNLKKQQREEAEANQKNIARLEKVAADFREQSEITIRDVKKTMDDFDKDIEILVKGL